ncbi:RING finger protein 32 isoform X2 [Esox lucius]|uniref:RING finger protein 32 isoform X2 n=1 Tax=Esox lucius TaxID=8010 RepID=UPI0014777ADD|nr:RING finger protein 32 isoform X2 [Esox lucius]
MRKGLNYKATSGNLAITSVALQDHISRNVMLQNLSQYDPGKTRCRRTSPETHSKVINVKGTVKQQGSQWQDGPGEKEYVLDPASPPLTLAQKMGLVESPARRLTADEWTQVKLRSVHEGESKQPCAICREEFRLRSQVLLSCSHVFHKDCLKAFERFSGRKCCPMCRKEQYETRVIHDGAYLFKERIQACWRGYVVRKWYRHLRKTIPPKDKRLRQRFFERKFQELNDSLVQFCHTDVEAFLNDIDRSASSSRRVFHQFDTEHVLEPQEDEWLKIQEKVIQRDTWDCPICLSALCSPSLGTGRTPHWPQSNRSTVLLSCSHLFHQPCLEAFEAFCLEGQPTCPLCRSLYHKILV